MKNIHIEYLAPNCTSVIQPCDAGIIKTFKSNFLNKLLIFIPKQYEEKKLVEAVNVKQAIYMTKKAWREVSKQTIEKLLKVFLNFLKLKLVIVVNLV